jgi:hypothetical protein
LNPPAIPFPGPVAAAGRKESQENGEKLLEAAPPRDHGTQDNRWDHRHRLHEANLPLLLSDRDFHPYVEHLGLEAA